MAEVMHSAFGQNIFNSSSPEIYPTFLNKRQDARILADQDKHETSGQRRISGNVEFVNVIEVAIDKRSEKFNTSEFCGHDATLSTDQGSSLMFPSSYEDGLVFLDGEAKYERGINVSDKFVHISERDGAMKSAREGQFIYFVHFGKIMLEEKSVSDFCANTQSLRGSAKESPKVLNGDIRPNVTSHSGLTDKESEFWMNLFLQSEELNFKLRTEVQSMADVAEQRDALKEELDAIKIKLADITSTLKDKEERLQHLHASSREVTPGHGDRKITERGNDSLNVSFSRDEWSVGDGVRALECQIEEYKQKLMEAQNGKDRAIEEVAFLHDKISRMRAIEESLVLQLGSMEVESYERTRAIREEASKETRALLESVKSLERERDLLRKEITEVKNFVSSLLVQMKMFNNCESIWEVENDRDHARIKHSKSLNEVYDIMRNFEPKYQTLI